MTSLPAGLTRALDTALDRSVVLGYTRVGSAVRRRFWAADPPAGRSGQSQGLVPVTTGPWTRCSWTRSRCTGSVAPGERQRYHRPRGDS